MNYVDPGHHLEQLARYMCAASDTNRRHADLAGIGIRVKDKLGNRLGRDHWIYRHDIWYADDASDWRDIAKEIEAELIIKGHIDGVRRSRQEERVAVGRGTHDGLGADIVAGTRPIIDDELLAEPLREPLSHQAREDIDRAARRGRRDQAHRPRRIDLPPCAPRDSRQRGCTCGQMQKISAGGSFISNLPPFTSF